MRAGSWMAAIAMVAACSFPARAETPPDPFAGLDAQIEALLGPRALMDGVVTEQDVDLVLNYLKAALLAAASGREPPSDEELARRAEAIRNALAARDTLAGLLLLDALDARARQWLRDAPSGRLPPPSRPYLPAGD